ncbi:MAG: histidine ammonia-lyase [Candidatus Eisenbacteria bacterium]|uniref:Histidine ammonia-lyase n=1 Tax=Eiseniibacteriota bacterium TaxID=2212470 RepID=A0A849SGV9_UNCEI|nr:histidine ammonia-lyase [Candidatus Eisenbacteria bacterium]
MRSPRRPRGSSTRCRASGPSWLRTGRATRARRERTRKGGRVIELGSRPLTIDDVVRVAREGEKATLGAAARGRMRESRAVVERAVQSGRVIYGVTTGFGELKNRTIPPEQVRDLQLNLLRSHRAGVGRYAPTDVVRAMMLLRAASLARGASGCRPEIVEGLLALLEADVTPVVPVQGSVGASGDLAPLAHLASVLIGEGEAWLGLGIKPDAPRLPAALALRNAGLQPLTLEAKEGLALINGTQFSTAFALLGAADARAVWEAGVAAAALSTEVLMGSFRPAREAVQRLRPYRGALETARRLRAYAEDSAIVASHENCGRVQDAYSLRCVPQVMGASYDALLHVEQQLEIEIESVNDNPLVFPESDEVISAGLFHAQPIGLAADYLKIAVAEIASLSERRIDRLVDARVSELPAVLANEPGLESGYMLAQYTAAALVSENKVLCHPASVDSIPTGGGIEDHVSMAPIAARHLRQVVDNAARVIALELLCGCRALEFRRPLAAGLGSERLYGTVRRLVPAPEGDRPLSEPCETIARWVLSRQPQKLAEEVLAS